MKNKNNGAVNRAKKKHAKNVARKNKGAAYGKSVASSNQIKKLQEPETRLLMGVSNAYDDYNVSNTIIIS